MLDHKHLIITATVMNVPRDVDQVKAWILDLVKTIDMEILSGPDVIYYAAPGNTGITATTIITTSHIVLHTFESEDGESAKFELDVYSCKNFNVTDIFRAISVYNPYDVCYKYIDRSNMLKNLDMGFYNQSPSK